MRKAFLAITIIGLSHTAIASGNWVTFTDDTATRLTLTPFTDDPLGDPLNDAEEKDIAVADIDRDGDDDVIVVRKEPFSTPGARQDILLMNEGGVLTDRTSTLAPGFLATATDSRDVFIGEFTGDIWLDVVIANTFEDQPRFYRNLGESGGTWLGLVDETSTRFPTIDVPADVSTVQFCALWAGDLTGNGALDIFFSNYNPGEATNDVLFINDGSGNFTNETAARLGSYATVAFGTSVEIHDVDNDMDNDIVKISTLYAAPPFDVGQFILFNDGNGVFDQIPFQSLPTDAPYMFTIGDLNNDNLVDQVLIGDNSDRVSIATAATPGSVTYNTYTLNGTMSARTQNFGGNAKLADVDGDGYLDAGIAPIDVDIQNCGFSDEFALLRNNQNGILTEPWTSGESQNFHVDPHDFGFIDVNNDGCTDIIMGLCTGWRVFTQDNCAVDSDGDGVDDSMDNCTEAFNPSQCDSDGDGFGNHCDGDLDNSGGLANFGDLEALKQDFGASSNAPGFNVADINCSGGVVNFEDVSLFKLLFGTEPGPSAGGN